MRRGTTLIELVIYFGLSVVVLLVVGAFYTLARTTQSSSNSSYMIGGNTEIAIGALRRDLSQCPLASIVSYPTSAGGAPGVSMASALTDTMQTNPYGVPNWDRTVYYALIGKPGDKTGTLYRYEDALANPNFLPLISPTAPDQKKGEERVALHNVLMPNTTVDGLADVKNYTSDQFGGFRVQFVQRDNGPDGVETLTSDNPGAGGDPADHTELVEVELKILNKSTFGKPDLYGIKFRVHPIY